MKKTNAIRLLDQQKIEYKILEYQYDAEKLSVQKIAAENKLSVSQVFKTLVAKGDKNGVVVALVSGEKNLNFKALAKASGNKKITLIAVKDLLQLTGYIRGGCSPIGMKKNFPVFIDISAEEFDEIFVNAGARGILIKIKVEDLVEITGAKISNIVNEL